MLLIEPTSWTKVSLEVYFILQYWYASKSHEMKMPYIFSLLGERVTALNCKKNNESIRNTARVIFYLEITVKQMSDEKNIIYWSAPIWKYSFSM